jgi:hypothetical protein
MFDKIYYKEYECEFLKCIQEIKSPEQATIIFSQAGHVFLNGIFLPVLVITAFAGAVLFLLIETWPERFKAFGIEFFFIGIFFFLTPYLKNMFSGNLTPESKMAGDVFDMVFNLISPILLIFLVVGIILMVLWIITKFFLKKKEAK